MLIDVKEMHPPTGPRRSGTVVTMEGTQFDCWPNLLRTIQVGKRYEVETSTNDRGYTSITKAEPINGVTPNGKGVAHPTANGNGAAKTNGHASAPAAPAGIVGEAEFVGRAIHAFILKGDVTNNRREVLDVVEMLREVWRTTSPWQNGGGHGVAS
jgi:hypothetical protein